MEDWRKELMVGWGFAFGRGIVILLWTILWGIVAGIVALLITGGSLLAIISNPTAAASNPLGFAAALFLGIFISVLIVTVGVYASIVKVTVDSTIRQLENSGLLQRQSYGMGSQPTLNVAQAQRFCPSCGKTIPVGVLKCPNCGATL